MNPVVEALLMNGSKRPAPRPYQDVAEALMGKPAARDNIGSQSTPTLQGLMTARYLRPPPEVVQQVTAPAQSYSQQMLQAPTQAPQQANWQDTPVVETAAQSGSRENYSRPASPIEVELPDGTIVEFPAGTSNTVMQNALQREYGHGLTGGASRASYSELMTAMRRADSAGDASAARRLGELAVKAREREQTPARSNGDAMQAALLEKAKRELASRGRGGEPDVGPRSMDGDKTRPMRLFGVRGPDGQEYEIQAPDEAAAMDAFNRMISQTASRQNGTRQQGQDAASAPPASTYQQWMDASRRASAAGDTDAARLLAMRAIEIRDREKTQALDSARQRRTEAESGPPQIVGGVIMPPPVPSSGQWDAQPAQMGAKDVIRGVSDAAGDMLGAGAAGVTRGVTGIADLPGVLTGGAGKLTAAALERSGIISPGVAQGMRESFDMMPMGSGDQFRRAAATVTGGASEFRGDTVLGNYAGTVGEFLPSALALGGGSVANALRYGVVPALSSETAGQLTKGTAAEPWARAGAAIATAPVSNLAERGFLRAISPYGGADPGRLSLAQVLDDAGVPVSAGQRVGSEALRRREGMTAAGQALNDTQREALTRAALKTAGTDASRATPEVLAETAQRIGSVFDDVARGVDLTPEPATVTALAQANETYKQLAPKAAQAPLIGEIVKRMAGAFRSGDAVPASTVNSWRSNLSKLTTSSDGATRSAAIEAMTALDDAMASTLTGMGRADDVARLSMAREQWRNFLAIQKAVSGAGENAAAGILSPSALRSAVVQQGRASYAQGGRGELGELARAAEGVIRPLPSSGTAENIRALGLPALGWTGAGAGIGASLGGGPVGAALGSMAGAAFPAAAGAVRMSRPVQTWLGNQFAGRGGSILPVNVLSPVVAALLAEGK